MAIRKEVHLLTWTGDNFDEIKKAASKCPHAHITLKDGVLCVGNTVIKTTPMAFILNVCTNTGLSNAPYLEVKTIEKAVIRQILNNQEKFKKYLEEGK